MPTKEEKNLKLEKAIIATRDLLMDYLLKGKYCKAQTAGSALTSLIYLRRDSTLEVAPQDAPLHPC